MRTITWNSDLSVGIDEIDAEHQVLIKYLNDMFVACSVGQGPAVLSKTLCWMQRYSREHFAHEEDLMHKLGYPGIDEHRQLHVELVSDLDDLIDELENGVSHDLSNKTMQLLEDWLLQHILVEDKKIGRYIGAID
ncbi:MAG: hemerythrin family protein [Magnetovibrio sp.]|nr:hemerythrin family protein [Magnetovibrio sp.]